MTTSDSKPPLRPHWSGHLQEIREQLLRYGRVLVASDFDGTLSPIVEHPGDASLETTAPEVLANLERLAPRVQLAFLSGRSLGDLAARLKQAAHNAIFAGNHGLEIRGLGSDWRHPSATANRRHLDELLVRFRDLLSSISGLEMEDKGASITLHYRRVRTSDLPVVISSVSSIEVPEEIRVHEGKKVFEFRPKVDWNKGSALRKVAHHLDLPDAATVFLGDDATDEDVFRELSSEAITVHVGLPSDVTAAKFNAVDPADAVRFLREVFAGAGWRGGK